MTKIALALVAAVLTVSVVSIAPVKASALSLFSFEASAAIE
jgi:hypothetical protein